MKFRESFPYDLYQFLIKPLRDADTDGVLERYMMASQEGFEQIQDNILSVDALRDSTLVPDQYVDIQTWLVGWTPEMEYIKQHLTTSELRRLLTLSVPMWKTKTSPAGIVDTLRLFTGQDALLWDWFAVRPVVDELALGYQRLQANASNNNRGDFWVIGGNDKLYGDGRMLTYVWISDESDFSKQLAHDLLQLNRPAEESFVLCAPQLVDDFHQGLTSFDLIDGTSPQYDDAGKSASIPVGSFCTLNVTSEEWRSYSYSVVAQWVNSANQATLLLRGNTRVSGSAASDYYEIQISPTGTLTLYRLKGGVGTLLATTSLGFSPAAVPDARITVELRVAWDDVSVQTVQAVVDSEVILDASIAYGQHLEPGQLSVSAAGPVPTDKIKLDNLLAYELTTQSRTFTSRGNLYNPWVHGSTALESYPVTSQTTDFVLDTITMMAAMAPTSLPSEKAKAVLWSEAFTSGTLSGFTNDGTGSQWAIGTHRSQVGNYSAGFGTGASAYYGGASGSATVEEGYLTSPSISIPTAWVGADPDKYKLTFHASYCWSKDGTTMTAPSHAVNGQTQLEFQDSAGVWQSAGNLWLSTNLPTDKGNSWQHPQGGIVTPILSGIMTTLGTTFTQDVLASGTFRFRVKFRHNMGSWTPWEGTLWVDNFKLYIEEI